MTALVTFALAAAVTFLLRSSMMLVGHRWAESERLADLTALVTPAVLAAMIASSLVLVHGHRAAPHPGAVLAVVVAWLAVRRTGNLGVGLALGLGVNALLLLAGVG